MRNATRIFASTFGGLVALAGLEHGIGEVLQGNIAPGGTMILSWPGPGPFYALGGEPAMTVIPNLLITGSLTIAVSLAFLAWVVLFVQRKNAGLVLFLLCIAMLLVGGGFGPPILGVIVAAATTKINSPLTWWRAHLSHGLRHFLAMLWPWSFGACLIDWLLMLPGMVILGYFFGVNDPNLIFVLLIGMFGFLLLTIVSGFAYDIQRQVGSSAGTFKHNEGFGPVKVSPANGPP
ncbi:MAG: hypothetical protein M1546_16895 [Chloroflexi bacterium]|nr:hypothetical protein [Chloroflexota bacterium]